MWKAKKEVDISRETIIFCSVSDGITKKPVAMDRPANGGGNTSSGRPVPNMPA